MKKYKVDNGWTRLPKPHHCSYVFFQEGVVIAADALRDKETDQTEWFKKHRSTPTDPEKRWLEDGFLYELNRLEPGVTLEQVLSRSFPLASLNEDSIYELDL
jgi:hypothetical protein